MKAEPTKTHVATQWKYDGAPLISCRFDPQGRYAFSCAEDFTIQRWRLSDGQKTVLKGHDSWPRGLVFSKDGAELISSGCDQSLIWWSTTAEQPEPIRKIEAHQGWIRTLAVSPDGGLLASGGNDGKVKLWSVADGSPVREMQQVHEKNVYSTLFHPSGELLLSGDLQGVVHQWETATGKLVRSFDAKALHTYNAGQGVDYGGVRSLSLSPDGKQLACAGLHKASNPLGAVNEPLVLVFDWESQKLIRSLVSNGVKGVVWRATYHPDGFLVAVSGGSGGGYLLFWKTDEDKPFHQLKLPDTGREMDLHPDGVQVATVHFDRHLRISRMAPKPT